MSDPLIPPYTQHSCPTGASPITFSPRAMEAVKARRTQVPSFYFDVLKIAEYWGIGGGPRKYHHTGLTSTYYALREALATLVEEVCVLGLGCGLGAACAHQH